MRDSFWGGILSQLEDDSAISSGELFGDRLLMALPEPSREKITLLVDARKAAHSLVRETSDALQEARKEHGMALAEARRRHTMNLTGIASLDDDYASIGKVPESPPPTGLFRRALEQQRTERQEQAARLMAPVQAKRRAVERAVAAHDRAVGAWQQYSFLEPASRWLARMVATGTPLEHRPASAPRIKDYRSEVDRIRQELVRLSDAWRAAESAPAPKADFRQRAVAEIEALAARGAPTVSLQHRGPNPLRIADLLSTRLETFHGAKPEESIHRLIGDPAPFLAWLNRDALVARVNELIDATADDAGALSYDAREAEFARISSERLALEFQEEGAICAAASAGLNIPRRRDADPRAILEVAEQ